MDTEKPSTESRNPDSKNLDTLPPLEIVRLMHEGDSETLRAVGHALPAIAEAALDATRAIEQGGRIFYAGAGTSGRLAVLDASEVQPTFGSTAFRAVIAGGPGAMTEAIEGAEDDTDAGAMEAGELGPEDMAVGISASGRAPFVIGFMNAARERGARTWMITCTREAPPVSTDGLISLPTGPELIAGSTRLKAGTATKMALNMLSTATMVLMGGTYDGLMVDVMPSNRKLAERAEGIVMEITGRTRQEASRTLVESGMRPKTAALMLLKNLSSEEAEAALKDAGGSLRKVLGKKG
jgi:N-acetylmuramic acid 6-phosphate etherase